ncbi:MAG: FAD:protein FMN transferase [Clostridia bacterium]
MMKSRAISTLCALLILLCPTNSSRAEAQRYELSFFDVFDTYSTIIFYADSKAQADEWGKLAHSELMAYHQLYDIYHEYEGVTGLCAVNRMAGQAPVRVDERLLSLLLFSKEMDALTQGRVNIAMGSVLTLWHDARQDSLAQPEKAALPDRAALEAAQKHTNIEQLVLDEAASTVFFADPLLKLDVGAIAKGYATERVAQVLIQHGVTSALLSIGGNVRAIGAKADGDAYQVAIQNPDQGAGDPVLLALPIVNTSVVTSGDYERFFTVDGKNYHHIIDPDTLMPSAYMRSVTILTQDGGLADALSTALFLMPQEKGQALLDQLGNAEAIWVTPEGTVVKSGGLS